MTDRDALFPESAVASAGPVERAVAAQLDAWQASGHLAGPEHAAVRFTLRRMAWNADHARPGQGLALATDRLLDQLRSWAPSTVTVDDAWMKVLADASTATIPD